MINSWLTYNQEANQCFYNLMVENSLLSHNRIKRLFSHLLIAEHIWYSRILNKKPLYSVWSTLEETQIEEIMNALKEDVKAFFDLDIKKEVSYSNSKGESFVNSMEDILLHVVNHASYHRGQISEELKRLDIKPPETDFIFYKRNRK